MKQTVLIAVPTAYDDVKAAQDAVKPYVAAMRVVAEILDLRALSARLVQTVWDEVDHDCELHRDDAEKAVFAMLSSIGKQA